MRSALFFAIAAAILALFNWTAWAALTRIHPRRRKLVAAVMAIGNVMWPFFPLLNARTGFSRAVRATLGPPWFAWQCFAIVYTALIALIALTWLPFRRPRFTAFAHLPSK